MTGACTGTHREEMMTMEILELKRRNERHEERQFIDSLPKSVPLVPKVIDPPKKGYYKTTSCRRCGFGVSEAGWKYCPNCGQAIMHYQYAGTQGWTNATANKVFRKMMEEHNDGTD